MAYSSSLKSRYWDDSFLHMLSIFTSQCQELFQIPYRVMDSLQLLTAAFHRFLPKNMYGTRIQNVTEVIPLSLFLIKMTH